MSEHSNVVDRADSLMRRRRSFVAAPANNSEAANVLLPVIEDDDLPVLTEIVSAETAFAEDSSNRFDETQVSLLASDIAHAIGQQMTFDLPCLLEAVLLHAGEELRAGITATMETALRDFIARRKQLHLPLDEPNRKGC
ncbi:hypothetical protein [Propionivibrio sp.]|uniref:hypothetical protein n=1 Tax=Propionivibrio sp. TaxID=2212460 RepID=UPI002603951F|nr:hypothetical protein [Propionivibrio sp.]